jgi:hypothetical protein
MRSRNACIYISIKINKHVVASLLLRYSHQSCFKFMPVFFLCPKAFSKSVSLYKTIINMHTLIISSTDHTYLHLIIQKHNARGAKVIYLRKIPSSSLYFSIIRNIILHLPTLDCSTKMKFSSVDI